MINATDASAATSATMGSKPIISSEPSERRVLSIVDSLPKPVIRPRIHGLILGRPSAGKSTFVATGEKPMLVALCDPPDKAQPYLDRGNASEIKKGDYCYYQEVFSKVDPERLVIRVEYWGEPNPAEPSTYPRFIQRFNSIEAEIKTKGWKTLILDTVTYFELMVRYYSANGFNKDSKDGRQHYAFSANACEQYVMMRWPNLLMANTFVLAHIDDQKDETDEGGAVIRKMAAMPGKMPNRVGGGFGEVWRVYQDESGAYTVQTAERPGSKFDCKSLKKFPDGCYPDLEVMWKEWEKKNGQRAS